MASCAKQPQNGGAAPPADIPVRDLFQWLTKEETGTVGGWFYRDGITRDVPFERLSDSVDRLKEYNLQRLEDHTYKGVASELGVSVEQLRTACKKGRASLIPSKILKDIHSFDDCAAVLEGAELETAVYPRCCLCGNPMFYIDHCYEEPCYWCKRPICEDCGSGVEDTIHDDGKKKAFADCFTRTDKGRVWTVAHRAQRSKQRVSRRRAAKRRRT